MWTIIALIVGSSFLYVTATKGAKLKNSSLLFVGLAIWLRYFLSAFHEITFPPIVAGLSINALAAIIVASIGIFLLPIKILLIKKLTPVYIFIICIFISALINVSIIGFVSAITKWVYFIAITMHFFIALNYLKTSVALRYILIPLGMPVVLQVMSIFLGHSKATEADGSVSFVGGYNHEAVFSILVFTFLCMLTLVSKKKIKFQNALIIISIFSLIMANYRTTLLACLPVLIFYMWTQVTYSLIKTQRLAVSLFLTIAVVGFGGILVVLFGERFSDIAVVINQAGDLIKPAIYYSKSQQDIFSARVYYWSLYITEYVNSGLQAHIFGFGPDSWKNYFEKYAHNSFVSYLFEYGILGLVSFVFLLTAPIFWLLKITSNKNVIKTEMSSRLLACHLGFFILNLATMPLWQIEGSTLYALITALTIYNQYTVQNNQFKDRQS